METSAAIINPLDLTGRHVLVTGASSGIGRATAVMLARLGGRLTITGRDAGRLGETLACLHGEGHDAAAFDLAALDDIPGWMRDLAAARGTFDGLAHCAGVQTSKPMRTVDAAFIDTILRVNVSAGLMLARGFRQRDCHAPGASIVLIASASAFVGQATNVVYCASKGGLVSGARALAVELARDGIRVNCICPALVETEMAEKFRSVMTDQQYEDYKKMYPLGLGRPDDIASAVAFFLAKTGRWLTGTSLLIDGGLLAGG
jgi:Dehydrogenases with different specificities (related to short-chain alcohol dehydrogenases)